MTVAELNKVISEEKGIVLYFKNDHCGPCKALRPKVSELVETSFPDMKLHVIDTIENPLLTSEFRVFSNPTILVYFEGREYIRKSKFVSIPELGAEIDRIYSMAFSKE